MACLILNSVPVSFGAVGTPTWFGFASLNLNASELYAVAWKTAFIHFAAAWEQMASHRFVQDTTDFVAAAEFLSRMADAKDVEGT
jgi:hypothetical protein